MRHEKFFIALERGKLKSSLRIALWVKSKMAATMEGEWVLDLPY